MNVERNLPVVRERKLAILKGDPELCAQQKKAGKLIARERIGLLLDAASFVELDVLNAEQELLNSRVAHTRAQHAQISAFFAVLSALGKLTPENLGLVE